MNNMFSKIDAIDITSIITEQDKEVIQNELNQLYEGSWESNDKQSDSDLLIESIIKEISDSLAITNIKLNKKIVESSISRVYPRFSKSLYKKVIRKLEESGFDVSKLKEDNIEDIQTEISDLKQQKDSLDKVEDIKSKKYEDEPSKSEINSKLKKAYAKLKSATDDRNDDLDNAFGEEKLSEENLTEVKSYNLDALRASYEKLLPSVDKYREADDENLALCVTVYNGIPGDDDVYVENKYTDFESFAADYEQYKDQNYYAYFEVYDLDNDDYIDGLESYLIEAIAVNATVDNIDQESKDKATIEKAIELAGDKTTIDNDTFRELRLKLANKDYDLVDRTTDYALIRGEDVIYTWLRAENTKDNLNEAEETYIDPEPFVKISDYYKALAPDDYQLDKINPNITFQELYDNIDKNSITSLIGDVDSDVRNSIINAMCDVFDIQDNSTVEISDDLPPYENNMTESVHVNVSGGNVDVSTDNTNLSVDGDNVDVHVEDGNDLAPTIEIPEPTTDEPELDMAGSNVSAEEITDEPVEEPATEEILDTPEDSDDILDDSEALQTSDIPGKVDHKRIELAKFESEDKITYRVSYLKEDDEICGWDLDCESDEEAIDSLDQFSNAGQITDDLLAAEFIDTGIDGISSFNYNNTNILLSTDGDNNIITINQDNAEPIVMKGDSFDDVLNQLIYWFIMNTDCPDCETAPQEEPVETSDVEPEMSDNEIDKEDSNE